MKAQELLRLKVKFANVALLILNVALFGIALFVVTFIGFSAFWSVAVKAGSPSVSEETVFIDNDKIAGHQNKSFVVGHCIKYNIRKSPLEAIDRYARLIELLF